MSLFVVSVPIGNKNDITLRAIETLRNADFLICEERKVAFPLLKRLDVEKELYELNEHTEEKQSDEIISLLLQGKDAAFFTDCGTPVFADPGTYFIKRCHESHIPIHPIPGPSSLMAALSVAGVGIKEFHFAGFLPRSSEDRKKELQRLQRFRCPVVIMDTPYRLQKLLLDVQSVYSGKKQIVLLIALTQPGETILRDSVSAILKNFQKNPFKKEFILILEADRPLKSKKHDKNMKRNK